MRGDVWALIAVAVAAVIFGIVRLFAGDFALAFFGAAAGALCWLQAAIEHAYDLERARRQGGRRS